MIDPRIIDRPYTPDPFEDDVPSGWVIGLVFFVFAIGGLVAMADEGRPLRSNHATHEPSLASRLGPPGECQAQGCAL